MEKIIVLIGTAWGAKHGGINVLNTDLAIAITGVLQPNIYKVVSIAVNPFVTELDEAEKWGVHLVSLKESDHKEFIEEERAEEIVSRVKEKMNTEGQILYFIGHDIVTGFAAIAASKLVDGSKSVVVRHMDYWSYMMYRTLNGLDTLQRDKKQKWVTQEADIVFAVGPKLYERAEFHRKKVNRSSVVQIIPGLPKINGFDFIQPSFAGITFGRFDSVNDRIKLGSLAVAGFCYAASDRSLAHLYGKDPSFTIIGIGDEEKEKFKSLAIKYSKKGSAKSSYRVPNIVPINYLEDRELLFDHLSEQTVCLALSFHEGFGLTGWEAISAEVPLILSENSGLFDLLVNEGFDNLVYSVDVGGEDADGNLQDGDIEIVSNKIKEIASGTMKAKRNARKLKTKLKDKYSWSSTAYKICSELMLKLKPEMEEKIWREDEEKIDKSIFIEFRNNPVVRDILLTKSIRVLKGDYLNSMNYPVTPYEAHWHEVFVNNCIESLKKRTLFKDAIKPIYLDPPEHQYAYIIDKMYSGEELKERRVILPLEFLFLGGRRRRDIKVISLARAFEFTLLYFSEDFPFLEIVSDPSDSEKILCEDLFNIIGEKTVDNDYVNICTYFDTMVDYIVNDAILNGIIRRDQKHAEPDILRISKWLIDNSKKGIVLCDMGLAYQVQNCLNSQSYEKRLALINVEYTKPVEVGIACRKDDIIWHEICKESLNLCLKSKDKSIKKSLLETKRLVEILGMQWIES